MVVRSRFSAEDVANARKHFEQGHDPMHLVLAIGAEPYRPPEWAIEACIRLHDDVIANSRTGNDRERLGQLLDKIAWFYFDDFDRVSGGTPLPSGVSYRAPPLTLAIQTALAAQDGKAPTDYPETASEVRIVRNAWKAEEAEGNEAIQLIPGIPTTARLTRVNEEWFDRNVTGWDARHINRIAFRHRDDLK